MLALRKGYQHMEWITLLQSKPHSAEAAAHACTYTVFSIKK